MIKKSIAVLAVVLMAACTPNAEEAQVEETTPAAETTIETPVVAEPAPIEQTAPLADSAAVTTEAPAATTTTP